MGPSEIPVVAIAQEQLSPSLIAELMPLLTEHWRAVTLDADVPLDPDWDRYRAMEAQGAVRIWTARVDGCLAAFVCFVIGNHLHYRSLRCAHQDVLCVARDFSDLDVVKQLLSHAEQALAGSGMHMVVQHGRDKASITPWLHEQGYRKHDTILSKRI